MDTELERTPHGKEVRTEPTFTLDGVTRRYVDPKCNISRKVVTERLDIHSGSFEVVPVPTKL
eukprot:15309442-Alexandrium_andersonii.AAC.1